MSDNILAQSPSLITYTHTFNDKNEIIARQPNGLWYLPDGCTTLKEVPIGGCFTLILPASWQSSTFEVILRQVPKVDKEPCHYYRPRESRVLSSDEIEYLKGVMRDDALYNNEQWYEILDEPYG